MCPRLDTPVSTEYQSEWVREPRLRYPLNIRVNESQIRHLGTHWISEWLGPRAKTLVPTEYEIVCVPESVRRSENFGVDNIVFPSHESNSDPSVGISTGVSLILNPRSGVAF